VDADDGLGRFREWLAREGLHVTMQRDAVARAFFAGPGHVTLLDLLGLVHRTHPRVGYVTVYRTMRLLTQSGLAVEHHFGDAGQALFEPVGHEHHDHFICLTCGRMFEVEEPRFEGLQNEVAARLGLRVVSHRHEIYGECIRENCPGIGQTPVRE
jgi:Fur family ferric uptake transcriptional regulator